MIVLDTNCLIFYLVQPGTPQAKKVTELLKQPVKLTIPDVVFPELEYVLRHKYQHSRKKIAQAFEFLTHLKQIQVNTYVPRAVDLFRSNTFDMADCLIAAQAEGYLLASFDKKLLKVTKVKPYWK